MARIETLLYIISMGKVLLIEKKRGLGAGLYNGVGGQVEDGELPLEAAVRECLEEVGVKPLNVEWMGVIEFINDGTVYSYVHVFLADGYDGELKETDEAKPVWFPINDLPFEKMWIDDRFWLPLVLIKRRKIYGSFHFKNNWSGMVKMEIYELRELKI